MLDSDLLGREAGGATGCHLQDGGGGADTSEPAPDPKTELVREVRLIAGEIPVEFGA
jgi:hypothetical protein